MACVHWSTVWLENPWREGGREGERERGREGEREGGRELREECKT